MTGKPPIVRDNTPEEEAAIRRGIAADPDTWEIPVGAKAIKRGRGRPPGKTKTQITINVDNDVLAQLKSPEPKGWQTRLNAALRKGLGLKAG